MCLKVEFNLLPFVDGKMTAYKVLAFASREDKPLGLYSPYIWQPWDVGANISNRTNSTITPHEQDIFEVEKGIHVFSHRHAAETAIPIMSRHIQSPDSQYKIVPVTCYEKDKIAAGSWNFCQAAVFVKVYLSQEGYDRALSR